MCNNREGFFFKFCLLHIETAFLLSVSEISGPAKTQTYPSFYDEEDEGVYGSADIDKMENKPLAVDNTIHSHMGHPSLVTPSSANHGKKRPAINASSSADPYPRRLSIALSPLVSLVIVCQRCWW